MSIGVSIFLIAIGAIVAFAVHAQVGWLDLSRVGWVLMIAGAVGLLVTMMLWQRRRTVTVTRDNGRQVVDDVESPSPDSLPRG
jgi:hypothetical protein